MGSPVIRSCAWALPALGVIMATRWLFAVTHHFGIATFDRLFPGFDSWPESGLPHPYFQANLYLAVCCLTLPSLLAGLALALPALCLRMPPVAVATCCVLGSWAAVLAMYPIDLAEIRQGSGTWTYAFLLGPPVPAGLILAYFQRRRVRQSS
jgi:hypothetical protein